MNINKRVIVIGVGVLVLGTVIFFLAKFFLIKENGPASLKITSNPAATIFLDNQHLGKTPYEDKVKPGEYSLKLVPDSINNAASFEAKIKLEPATLTFINRNLKENELVSSGESLTLEKINSKSSEVAVLSTPDAAMINLDGINKGTTPQILTKDVDPGDHEISVSANGFSDGKINVKAISGYKVIVSFKLALLTMPENATNSAGASPTPKPTASASATATPKSSTSPSGTPKPEPARPYVKILDTGTNLSTCSVNCLRIRVEPNAAATEAGKINSGETAPFLGEQSGWYKIKYETTKEGWISGQYAEKFE